MTFAYVIRVETLWTDVSCIRQSEAEGCDVVLGTQDSAGQVRQA